MDTLTSIRAFRQVVESGSFVAAAARLEMSPASITKHVQSVEHRLGVRLLNRNPHKISLTEPGRIYFDRCRSVLDELHTVELELGSFGRAPRGTLRITLPSVGATQRVAGLLARYRRRYPEVVVDVSFDDRFADLVQEGYDVALRITSSVKLLPPGLSARPICSATFYLAASREYIDRRGAPQSLSDLANHDFVALDNVSRMTITDRQQRVDVPLRVVMRYRSMDGVANALVAGIGVAVLPGLLFDEPQFKDVLTPILPECPVREATLYAVYGGRSSARPAIRTFIDFVAESLRTSQSTSLAPTGQRFANRDGQVPTPWKARAKSGPLICARTTSGTAAGAEAGGAGPPPR